MQTTPRFAVMRSGHNAPETAGEMPSGCNSGRRLRRRSRRGHKTKPLYPMKNRINWRHCVQYALIFGCFYALLVLCDETEKPIAEMLKDLIKGLSLMFACGFTLYKLTKKWALEGKIKL